MAVHLEQRLRQPRQVERRVERRVQRRVQRALRRRRRALLRREVLVQQVALGELNATCGEDMYCTQCTVQYMYITRMREGAIDAHFGTYRRSQSFGPVSLVTD